MIKLYRNPEFSKTQFIYNTLIISILSTFLFTSCLPKLHVKRMKYNEEKGFYTYPYGTSNIALRNDSGQLVTKNNLKPFLENLLSNNENYDFTSLSEQTAIISEKDSELVDLYAALIAAMEIKNKDACTFYISQLRQQYPKIDYFSDLLFLEGKIAENDGDISKAKLRYIDFLKFSEKKYPSSFRGNATNDTIKQCYLEQRTYAKNFLENNPNSNINLCLLSPTKKYYYQSYSKGFVLNREDYLEDKKFLPGFVLSYNNKYGLLAGAAASWLASEKYTANTQLLYSKYQTQFNLFFPIQLYKSNNYRFGLKLTPIFELDYIQKFDDKQNANKFSPNTGASISAGYTILPRLCIGASYTAYYFNEKNVHTILSHNIYSENVWSAGIQYLLIKGIAVRADVINGKPVLGLSLSGAFLGYNFFSKSVGLFNREY